MPGIRHDDVSVAPEVYVGVLRRSGYMMLPAGMMKHEGVIEANEIVLLPPS